MSFCLLSACVSTPPESKDTDKDNDALKSFVLSEVPADVGTHIDADFEGKASLLGARVEPAAAKPGDKVKLTMYWKSEQKLDSPYKLFTHIVDAAGERVLNIDNVGPLREMHSGAPALPPSEWTPGKVYVDEQTFTVPANVKTDKIQILTGIFSNKAGRLNVTAGPHDSSKRAIVTTIALSGVHPHANTRIPTLRVEKLEPSVVIKLDGKLDEPAWKDAAKTGPLVDVATGEPNKTFPVNGDVKVLWNDTGMYVGFTVTETDVVGGFKKGEVDPHLWTKDAVEIMVDPDGDGDNKDYYEIQLNPQNLIFDSQFDAYNEPKTEPNGPFGHQEWSSNAKSSVTVDGTLDKSTDEDKGYTVEVMLPWKSFGKAAKLPPELNSSWRMNFYAMKNNNGVAWSPILGQGNFHKAPRFGRIVWTKKGEPPTLPGAILKPPGKGVPVAASGAAPAAPAPAAPPAHPPAAPAPAAPASSR